MPATDEWSERPVWMVRGADGADVGPVSTSQIAQARAAGKLDGRSSVRHMNASAWENLDAFMARSQPPPGAQPPIDAQPLPSFEGTDEVTVQAQARPRAAPR
ncbi:MAG: hypothetical protein ACRELB_22320, partial [Polyangiaceae bacterium]